MGMDGETPSWLEEGGGSAAQPPPVPPPSPLNSGDSDAAAPAPAKSPRDAPPTDNVAGSILASMNAKMKKHPDATTAAAGTAGAEDNENLAKLIVFMRVLNMAASALLITASVSAVPIRRVYTRHTQE
jgi:hypothetical protein